MGTDHHTPVARLEAGKPPPAHYYATNLLALVRTVLDRYGDLLLPEERCFGERIVALPIGAQRLYARLIGRRGPLLREDSVDYAEVDDLGAALRTLATTGLIERSPPAEPVSLCRLATRTELDDVFAPELAGWGPATKAARVARVLERTPLAFLRWRLGRRVPWLQVANPDRLELYRLLFFGDSRQDLTTFVMRDLRVYRYEPVALCAKTRLFPDRSVLDRYLALAALQDDVATVGAGDDAAETGTDGRGNGLPRAYSAASSSAGADWAGTDSGGADWAGTDRAGADWDSRVVSLIARLAPAFEDRLLERRRSRLLNRLGRDLERRGADHYALRCYERSTLAPARERRMRILQRHGQDAAVECLRRAVLAKPESTLEAEFASRFARPRQRRDVPTTEVALAEPPEQGIEQHALGLLTADGGEGWHLENCLPMAMFGLAHWSWIFAPVRGAFLHPFQAGPTDLFWPDFCAVRKAVCEDPLDGSLKDAVRRVAAAKAGTANRLFSWQRFPPAVIEKVAAAMPEADLRALVEIVRGDLRGKRSGFPDLTVVYGPGRYEFVEVKGPTDQLQIHQRLWIQALKGRGLPVRVLRFRMAPGGHADGAPNVGKR